VTPAVTADLRRRFGLRDLEPETETTTTEERMAPNTNKFPEKIAA